MNSESISAERFTHLMRMIRNTRTGWALDDEGSLLVADQTRLDGVRAPEVREKTRRIVIHEDVAYVPQRLFEGFENRYEVFVDSNANEYYIDDYAFAHCRSLYWLANRDADAPAHEWDYDLRCAYPEDCGPHTVLDTPLQTYLDYDISLDFATLEKDWLRGAKHRSCLTEGLWGKRFVGLLQAELILMGRLKVPEYGLGNSAHDPVADEWMWFRGCMTALRRGVEDGESAMTYLAAQCARRAGFRRRENMRMDGMDVSEEKDAPDLYMEAAKAGSPQAQLWCAYCMEEGRYGMRKDPSTSQRLVGAVARMQEEDVHSSPVPLWFGELDVVRDRYHHLDDEMLYGSDPEEDRLWDQCGNDSDMYSREYWNPSWHTNRIRQRWSRW